MSKSAMTIPVFVPHMGCPYRCVFCNQWETSSVRTSPDAAFVRAKIRTHLATKASSVGHVEVAFFGGSFTAIDADLQRSLLDAAYGFVREGLLSGVRVSTRPDCIDPVRLALLREYGVKTIEIGAQSFATAARRRGRGHTGRIPSARRATSAGGLSPVCQLLPAWVPTQLTVRSRRRPCRAPGAVRIYPTVVLEHTARRL
jgi:histone acetyltransferase (RNA polymerase elongator complex component)